jgi:hypothetical protein
MKSLVGVGVVVAISGAAGQSLLDLVSLDLIVREISEVPLLVMWGAALLFIGRSVRARGVGKADDAVRPSAIGSTGLAASGGQLKAGI